MMPGGVTEVIWHFAGYLQIINDIARDRIDYDPAAFRNLQEDYVTPRPAYDAKPDIDELDSRGTPGPEMAPLDDLHGIRILPIRSLSSPSPHPNPDFEPSGGLSLLPRAGGGGGGGGSHHEITVHYQPGGQQSEVQIIQYNLMSDNDLLIQGNGAPYTHDTAFLTVHASAIVHQMADDANQQIPKEWWIHQNETGAKEFLKAHDEDVASRGGTPDAHSVEPGYYLNGVLQTPAPEPPDQTPATQPEPAPDLGHGLGQWAEVGSNFSFNAALIVDLSESGRSMIVMGDYFKTNAIFQTNSLMDHDHVDVSGGSAPALTAGDNKTDNIADFVQHPGIYASLPAHFAGPHWNVDVVEGNYYSVHTLVQMNYLMDNDIVVQKSADNHYEVHSGGNELGNLAQVFDGSIHYDLIIVAGAYHGMNVIFQNNILLNNDEIKLLAEGAGSSQSVVSGQNQLTNAATIENYGDENFKPMNGNLDSLATAVGNGSTSLDPSYGNFVDGSGGVFNVLYVKGDYYDVNAIWQTNVTSDVNLIIQLLGTPSANALSLHPDDTGTQSVTSGKDFLTNDAAIIDVGATNTYVNGETYGDTILVQANLLPCDKDHVFANDTHTLVPELIAFVNETQDEAPAAQPATSCSVHDDPIASVLH
jgi:hypothetical protein